MGGHGVVAIARGASGRLPDFMDLGVVTTRVHPEALARIRLYLPKAPGHFIQVVSDYHHLTVGNTDKLVRIRRLRICSRFLIDFAGELTIKVLYSAGTGHNHLSYSQHCRGRSTSGQERCRHSLYHSRPWVSQCAVANQPSPPQHDLSACIGELVRSTSD